MGFRFTLARPEQVAEVVDLYREAAAWQQANGVNIWPAFTEAFMQEEACAGRLVVAGPEQGELLCGCLSIKFDDPFIWGEVSQEPALYLHRLAIRRRFAGRGFTRAAVAWALAEARRRRLPWLRLDSWADNPRLCAWYERSGFTCMGDVAMPTGHDLPSHYDNITVRLYQIAAD